MASLKAAEHAGPALLPGIAGIKAVTYFFTLLMGIPSAAATPSP